jgi:hypothetical protein
MMFTACLPYKFFGQTWWLLPGVRRISNVFLDDMCGLEQTTSLQQTTSLEQTTSSVHVFSKTKI